MTGTQKLRRELSKADPRSKMVDVAIAKAQGQADVLINVLHEVQNLYGYLPKEVLEYIIQEMRLPPSRVYGVVTFYHFFSMKPQGENTCLVCTGTACYVKGAETIIKELEKIYQIKPGEVTADNKLGIQTARCLGACGLAPVVVINNEVVARVKPEEIRRIVEERLQGIGVR
jgi:bidirectional [NiFe] hydrogenase diaphorase subunit